ncbi:SDR family NAD(P)-dependent oxidoreductase [Dyadobacter aurulentus]|uniref:SDR family NAD(P)-dependent oxidoreductase n=1 Tax=Dyadobacter sp. UC 10 TaxID=2605428 RepID=UPI0011F107A2|nr:SDR family oxidoreductase [Dyadobacter sp. UC 10]KAA0988918.1 SDR family oxidoreductase [Dyadobacter sp. UC 10]
MHQWLQNKKIVIIGGTTGLGLAAALEFVNEGAQVVVVGRDKENCEKAQAALNEKGIGYQGDATQPETAEGAIRLCTETFGGFDGLYHVAGGSGRKFGDGPLHELSLEGWQYTFDLNLTSMMLSNQAAVREFLARKQSGTILNMSSVLGYAPSPTYFATHAYAAAKSAVFGFVKSIASYYAKDNIRINVVAPALVQTPMSKRASEDEVIVNFIKTKQPLNGGRVGTPEDLNGASVYFMSDLSGYTTGQILSVDGGWSVSEGQI